MSAIITTHSTSSISIGASHQEYLIAAHGSLSAVSGSAISSSGTVINATIQVLGAVNALSSTAIKLDGKDAATYNNLGSLTVAEGGTVASAAGNGFQAFGHGVSLNNSGFVSGSSSAVSITGSDFNIVNSGTLAGNGTSVVLSHFTGSKTGSFVNSGTLIGGINISYGDLILDNSGSILADHYALWLSANENQNLRLNNSGEMRSTGPLVVNVLEFDSSAKVTSQINNTGEMAGRVHLGSGNDTLFSSGSIFGLVETATGHDTVTNRGQVKGNVNLGAGNDTYRGTGDVTGKVLGQAGKDAFLVRADDLRIDGGAGADTVQAWRDLSDVMNVETVTLRGSANLSASLKGNTTKIALTGNSGNNVLTGGKATDRIKGGNGDDVLNGLQGKDTLTGGRGQDVFEFTAIAHSGKTAATRDVIADFHRPTDVIDLSGMVAGTLTWQGTRAFSASGDAELRVRSQGDDMLVLIDKNGNGAADSSLLVQDLAKLAASDFIL